jgi:NAD(P)H-flavin reductase
MVPVQYSVRRRRRESHDTVTIALERIDGHDIAYSPGQFNMLYSFGVGEVPISMSGDHRPGWPILHTIRAVGAVSAALCAAKSGDVVGVRGPFGKGWGIEEDEGADLVFVAGGIGLAPLRSAIRYTLRRRHKFGRLALLVGARSPQELVFARELAALRNRDDMAVQVAVDRAGPGWDQHVGVVTQLIDPANFNPVNAVALVCGPEVMMRFTAITLLGLGLRPEQIRVSLERNMRCAIGWCGHCQLGSEFVCKDGPVRSWAEAAPLLLVRER